MTEAEHQALDDALYARRNNIRIGYRNRQGEQGERVITVAREHFGAGFYAMGDEWGCGKTAPNVEGAIRLLLQDMATLIWMQVEPAA